MPLGGNLLTPTYDCGRVSRVTSSSSTLSRRTARASIAKRLIVARAIASRPIASAPTAPAPRARAARAIGARAEGACTLGALMRGPTTRGDASPHLDAIGGLLSQSGVHAFVPHSSTNDVWRVQFGRQAKRLTRPVAEQMDVRVHGEAWRVVAEPSLHLLGVLPAPRRAGTRTYGGSVKARPRCAYLLTHGRRRAFGRLPGEKVLSIGADDSRALARIEFGRVLLRAESQER